MTRDNRSGTCTTDKVRYDDEGQAAMALARVRRARLTNPDDLPPESQLYHCQVCGGWHLSSRPPLSDLAQKVQDQREQLRHLHHKYDTVKGDLRKAQQRARDINRFGVWMLDVGIVCGFGAGFLLGWCLT